MPDWQSKTIEANGIHIHYNRTGGDKPPLVLAHGFSDSGLCWTPVAEVLAEDYDVIMPDAQGHGRSDAPETGYSVTHMAADLGALIKELNLVKPVIMGHSMGGATTFVLAGTQPEVPGAIIIEDAGGVNIAARDNPAMQERMRGQKERMISLQSQNREALIEQARKDTPTWSEGELGPWADAKLSFNLRALERITTGVDDWQTTLSRITCPALLITADPERGAIVDEEGARQLQELIPQLEVVRLAGVGHNVRREQFTNYMKEVRSFLDRIQH